MTVPWFSPPRSEATLVARTPIYASTIRPEPLGFGTATLRGPTEDGHPSVAVLLSAHNGARFLQEQLDSLVRQSHRRWMLYWRDDGSSDAALAILQEFAAYAGDGRACFVPRSGRLGATRSYLTLLASAWQDQCDYFAFADQDDIWFDDKLTRGLAALAEVPEGVPALYCARQELVDEQLRYLGRSPAYRREVGFPAALTQNIATGCTVILNRAAAEIVLSLGVPDGTLHDWWCYLAVSAAGGQIIVDRRTVLLYRQHVNNLVGSPLGILRRGIAALRRGPGPFMTIFRHHVAALQAHPDMMSDAARTELEIIAAALAGNLANKLRVLKLPGFRRQTWLEDLVFRVWFLLG